MTHNFDDFTLIEIPFSYEEKEYILREASGDAVCAYRNALIVCTKPGPDGKPTSFEGLADIELPLVASCVKEVGNKDSIPVAVFRHWSSRMQKMLSAEVKKISEIDEEENTVESLTKEREELDEKIAKIKEESAKNV